MSIQETNRKESPGWLSWAVLLLLLIVALALRWRYIQEISLFVDEFVTAWAARNVLSKGLPIFPSGNFYPHGFLFTDQVDDRNGNQADDQTGDAGQGLVEFAQDKGRFQVGEEKAMGVEIA